MSQITTEVTAAEDVQSFFSSPAFHNHVRTWTFVILALFLIGFLYVHESNANAVKTALADQIVQQGQQQQASIDKQIAVLHNDTKVQVQQIQQQIQQVQTVAQAIAAIKQTSPAPITITPIVTQPASLTQPEKTTADSKATGDAPVATLSGSDLKILADNTLTCKAQAIELNSCKQAVKLDEQKIQVLQTEVDSLKKIKLQPAWKKTLITVGHIALGVLVGKVL